MPKIVYILLAATVLLFIPACVAVETEVAIEPGVEAPSVRVMLVQAFCVDTPQNRELMTRVLGQIDIQAYERLMLDPGVECVDRGTEQPPLAVRLTEDLGPPFQVQDGRCMQLVGFIDGADQKGFSWMSIRKTKCGYEV